MAESAIAYFVRYRLVPFTPMRSLRLYLGVMY